MGDPAATGPAVQVRGLTVAYGGHVALRDVSVDFGAGAVTAVLGPNGAGKSTLLHAVGGLVRPSAGTVLVDGAPPARQRVRIAYVLQHAHVNERLPVTVREVVAMGRYPAARALRRLGPDDRRRVDAALDRLDLAGLAGRHLRELSGGQRQRVLVAQGLVQEAAVLLLDEPLNGLDLRSRESILEAVVAERDRGVAVVHSTHDLVEASRADAAVLLAGRVVAAGSVEGVLTEATLGEAYGARLLRLTDGGVLFEDPGHHG